MSDRTDRPPSAVPPGNAGQELNLLAGELIQPEPTEWFLKGVIPYGCITLLEGRKCVGKSHIVSSLVAACTGGPPLPGWKGLHPFPSNVLLCPGEGGKSLAMAGALAAGAIPTRVRILLPARAGAGGLTLPGGLESLEKAVIANSIKLVLIDPLGSYVRFGIDMNNEQAVREIMEGIARFAERAECVVLMIRNFRKQRGGGALDRGIGSVAFSNVAKVILQVDVSHERRGWRVLSCAATNLGPVPPSRLFRIIGPADGGYVEWGETIAATSDELADQQEEGGERDALTDAKLLLESRIGMGEVLATDLVAEARAAGIGERTLRSAKAEMGVRSIREAGADGPCWKWTAPEGGWPSHLAALDSADSPQIIEGVNKRTAKPKKAKAAKAAKRKAGGGDL